MRKKGFATSAILYTMLLLFMVLMVGILNNLQNKKTILDALKRDTIQALEGNTITDAILDQIAVINNKITELETKITEVQAKNVELVIDQNVLLGAILSNTAVKNANMVNVSISTANASVLNIPVNTMLTIATISEKPKNYAVPFTVYNINANGTSMKAIGSGLLNQNGQIIIYLVEKPTWRLCLDFTYYAS